MNESDVNSTDQIPDGAGVWAQKRRLAAAMRDVIERLVTTEAPEEDLRLAADRLEQYARRLDTHPRQFITWGHPESSTAGTVGSFFDLSPVLGRSNPLAPPLELYLENDRIRGRVRLGWAYQGPPGHVHGGFVAAIFDEALGMAQSMTGNVGMTGTLTVRYRSPTPLYKDLTVEAWVERVEGRKIFTRATMHCGTTLTAEAEAVFIAVNFAGLQENVRLPHL